MVDSMFADCDATTTTCATSGTAEIEGSQITWAKDTTTGEITPTVVEEDGSTTTITITGAGEFNFDSNIDYNRHIDTDRCSGTMQKSLIRITRQVLQNTAVPLRRENVASTPTRW